MKRCVVLLAAGAAAALFGCDAMPTPKGFVRVDPPQSYTYRAVSADGAVLSVRTEENPRDGTLEFWSRAIGNELIDARGYKLDARRDVKSLGGTPGVEMLMKSQLQGVDYLYLLTVFVKSERVIVFEAAGPVSTLESDVDAIREAVRASKLL